MNANAISGVFTNDALRSLRVALDQAEEPDEFLTQADIIAADAASTLAYPFDVSEPATLLLRTAARGDGGTSADGLNAELVYEHLGALSRVHASDPRLWTHLALVEYREYMEQRWPLDTKTWKRRAADRWVQAKPRRASMIRHGIARLWWVANLTMDAKSELPLVVATGDPFAYTQVAFAKEDRLLAIFDRDAGQIPNVATALLDHIAADPDNGNETYVRELLKQVAREYGLRELAFFDREEARGLIGSLASAARQLVV